MALRAGPTGWRTQAVLHPVFAVTGVAHILNGALMPAIAASFHLNDRQSGTLFMLYFGGSALGAFLCRGNYARSLWVGFLLMAVCAVGVAEAPGALLAPAFLLFGVSVGMPMSAVSLYVGRNFVERRAATLTLLNFTWSCGALAAPLVAGAVLAHASYRAAYLLVAAAAALSAVASAAIPRGEDEERHAGAARQSGTELKLVVVFAAAAFLQVGVENTSAAWLTTFSMRQSGSGMVLAAYATSLYWAGFLASRGASYFLLLRAEMSSVFKSALLLALLFSVLLLAAPTAGLRTGAMFLLGAALAPVYPLVIAGFFARARHAGDSRWILATAGFGGSVLPWVAGWISSNSASLKDGMIVIPGALLLMTAVLPAMRGSAANTASD